MWEEWRAEIDRTVRNAELERVELHGKEQEFRDFSVTTLPQTDGQAPRTVPKHWRIRLASAKARPIL